MLTALWKCQTKLQRKSKLQIADVQNKTLHNTVVWALCQDVLGLQFVLVQEESEKHTGTAKVLLMVNRKKKDLYL